MTAGRKKIVSLMVTPFASTQCSQESSGGTSKRPGKDCAASSSQSKAAISQDREAETGSDNVTPPNLAIHRKQDFIYWDPRHYEQHSEVVISMKTQ
ncbi:hypothetical protein HOY80DRAFT_1045387 [Tuber brumale]|nr:hypothetical protein HOY80DRAFT_1045387 [Tuber brumale]